MNETKEKKTLEDIAGYEEEKKEARKIIHLLKNAKEIIRQGISLPKGILLSGKPGVGKTLLASAIIGESTLPSVSLTAKNLDSEGIEEAFEKAIAQAPCILFLDELDKIESFGGFYLSDDGEATVRTILTKMDGIPQDLGVVVIATLNDIDGLPPSLLRSGRFDKKIEIEEPKLNARKAIFDYYLGKITLPHTVDTMVLAKETPGFTGADIKNLVNTAALDCLGSDKELSLSYMESLIPSIYVGGIKKEHSKEENEVIAYHEIGHAIVTHELTGSFPSISLYQQNRVQGLTMREEDKENTAIRKLSTYEDEVAILLAGRASESVFLGCNYNGSSMDVSHAMKICCNLCELGYYGNYVLPSNPIGEGDRLSPRLTRKVEKILSRSERRSRSILRKNRRHVEALKEALIQKGFLTSDEVKEILVS